MDVIIDGYDADSINYWYLQNSQIDCTNVEHDVKGNYISINCKYLCL